MTGRAILQGLQFGRGEPPVLMKGVGISRQQEVTVFTIDLHQHPDHLLICLGGELDLDTSRTLRQQLSDMLQHAEFPFILDLSGLWFIDSSGLGVLLATARLPAERRPRIVLPEDGPVSRLFRTTRLDTLLGVYPSVDAALGCPVTRSAA